MNLFDSWGAVDRFGFQAMRLLLMRRGEILP